MTIGIGIPRADGAAKVTGRALYVDDLRPEGCLYGATVRSERAHARILGIALDPTYDWDGVTLVTARDIPGKNLVALITEDQPCLADGLVRHVTEPIALVAAPTRDRALEAVKHVQVTYEDLPFNLDPERAEGATPIYGADNVFKRITLDKGAPLGTIGGHVHAGTYRVGLQEQLYIEPQGMIAHVRPDGGVTVIGSMQCPYYVHKALKALLGHDRVNAVQAVTGGGFGGKEEYPSMVAAHAALLALKTGRPVKLIYRRDEDLRATTKRHPAIFHIRSVVASDGTLLEWSADARFDGGAYNTLTPVVLSRGVLHLTGPYRCDNVHIRGVAVATNTPPNGAFRGFGAPQAMWAVERHMDRIARSLGIDALALRRMNLLRDGDTTASGGKVSDVAGFLVLDAALTAADEPLQAPTRHPGGGRDYAPGRGVALVFHGCGFTGNGEASIKGKVALGLDGSRVCVYTASTDIGQGVETIFPQIVAAELGISIADVDMAPHDTAIVPDSGPTVASRTTMVVGGVAQIAAKKLRSALQAETGLDTGDFAVLLAARRSVAPLRVEHQYVDDGTVRWNPDTYQGDAYPTYGWSCAVVDLDVDRATGEVLYRRFISATDVGRAINPVLAEGQLEGGALQALGWATAEDVVLDARGCMRNDRLTNYIIPTAADAPEMVTILIELPFAGGPFGAKGIGEIPMDGPAAAVAQAIEFATGAVLDNLPMTPERVLEAMP